MARFLYKIGLALVYLVAFTIVQHLLHISTADAAFGIACAALAVAAVNERKW